jgi:hypothetical protein
MDETSEPCDPPVNRGGHRKRGLSRQDVVSAGVDDGNASIAFSLPQTETDSISGSSLPDNETDSTSGTPIGMPESGHGGESRASPGSDREQVVPSLVTSLRLSQKSDGTQL